MSILSDTTIRQLCKKSLTAKTLHELHEIIRADDEMLIRTCRESDLAKTAGLGFFSTQSYDQESVKKYGLRKHQVDRVVSELAQSMFELQDYGMIYPFNPGQTREVEMCVDHTAVSLRGEVRRLLNRNPELGVQHITKKIISSGTTSYGYDVTLNESGLKLFSNQNSTEIDPKRFDAKNCLVEPIVYTDMLTGDRYVRIPPHSYLLGVTLEYFRIPRDILAICLGKSTYARAGILINTTPIEPGFEGNVVIEIANTTPLPARVYLNEGIAQFLFMRGDQPCEVSYGDRGGKYQGQTGVQLPLV